MSTYRTNHFVPATQQWPNMAANKESKDDNTTHGSKYSGANEMEIESINRMDHIACGQ